MNKLECVFDVKTKNTIKIDLDEIIKSRALFQANSGGGKSYLLRKFLEESNGKVQQLIIDPEGEFKTLKEKYDYLLVSKEDSADIKLETRHAGLLARKLMETGASAILDLYELNPFDRIKFVKAFVEALVNLPKNLWHPCIIVIDEIHTFAPENAKGSSESLQAVADLASRGRKRGYALIGATQKLSKFHKDVAAELNTKFTGRCILDIDQKRAAAELGMKDYTELRNLKNEFYAFGPAISGTPILVKAYKVKTRHEDIGSSKPIQSASQNKINKLKESFKDLPAEAEHELKTIEDYKKKVTDLSLELRSMKNHTNHTNHISNESIIKAEQIAFQKGINEAERKFIKFETDLKSNIKTLKPTLTRISNYGKEIGKLEDINAEIDKIINTKLDIKLSGSTKKYQTEIMTKEIKPPAFLQLKDLQIDYNGIDAPRGGAMRILKACAKFYPYTVSRNRACLLAEMSPNSGSTATYLSELKSKELITNGGDGFCCTELGVKIVGDVETLPQSHESMLNMWLGKLSGKEKDMLKTLCEIYPQSLSKEGLAEKVGMAMSGSFSTYLSTLRSNSLIKSIDGMLQASEELFPS
jgi:hypothetical protein